MPSSMDYLNYILERLSGAEEISWRAMMGEYILYYRGKIVGGVYDNRLLVKPVKAAAALMPDAPLETPYEGARKMLAVEPLDDGDFLITLFEAMYDELPAPRPKRKK